MHGCILPQGDTQIEFCDTPGILLQDAHIRASAASSSFVTSGIGRMMAEAWQGALDADVAVLMVDAARRLGDAELSLAQSFATNFGAPDAAGGGASGGATQASTSGAKRLLVLNKIDLMRDRTDLLPLITRLTEICEFDAVFLISALNYDGVEDLKDFLFAMSTRRAWRHAPDARSEMTDVQRVAEVIREKLYQRLNQELPYQIEQRLGEWRELENDEFQSLQRRLQTDPSKSESAGAAEASVAADALSDMLTVAAEKQSAAASAGNESDATATADADAAPLGANAEVNPENKVAATAGAARASGGKQSLEEQFAHLGDTTAFEDLSESPAVRELNALARRRSESALPSAPVASTAASATAALKPLRIVQFLYVAKESQAKILVGAGGSTLRAVTERAQRDLEQLLGRPIVLSCRVRTRPKGGLPKESAIGATLDSAGRASGGTAAQIESDRQEMRKLALEGQRRDQAQQNKSFDEAMRQL